MGTDDCWIERNEGIIWYAAGEALNALGAKAITPLIAALKNGKIAHPSLALDVLAWNRGRAFDPLISLLKEKNEELSNLAMEVLGRIGVEVRGKLEDILNNKTENKAFRAKVKKVLGQINRAQTAIPL